MFRESFKYYKSKVPKPDFKDVIDFDALSPATTSEVIELDLQQNGVDMTDHPLPPGIDPVYKWKCYQLKDHPGILVIRCPFQTQAQRYWIARCLQDFPKDPNVKNLNVRLFQQKVLKDWWRELHLCNNDVNEARRIKISMRWVTLGYHHNWDTKEYSEDRKTPFPTDLAELCKFFATALGFDEFHAEAAIVNYYPIGTTLAGHTDHSEMNLDAPLFSFSFGQTAIFLIGGQTREEKPTALFLKSGDILVMSKESRICFHAVPRVMKANLEPWNTLIEEENECKSILPHHKRLKTDIDYILKQNNYKLNSCYDAWLYQSVRDEAFWLPFKKYLNDSRININVRQVLLNGVTSLPS